MPKAMKNEIVNEVANDKCKFEDTVAARCQHSKMRIVYLCRLIVSATLICFSLLTYEYWDPYDDSPQPFMYLYLHIAMTVLSVLAVLLYILQITLYGKYLRINGTLKGKRNIFMYEGWMRIAFYCILLFVHPIYKKGDTRITENWEGFYDKGSMILFSRMHNEYLILIQFTVHFFTILYLMVLSSEYAGPIMDRVCRLNGCSNNFLFVFRALLVEIPITLSMNLTLISLIYYSIAVRITENGYLRTTYLGDFDTLDQFEAALLARGTFWTYNNMIWNIFITMATIGYGDINVFATFSRVMIFFVALTGLVTISIMVVAYSNFFQLDNMQASSLQFFNALELKLAMRDEVSKAVNSYLKMFYAARDQKYSKYKTARINMESYIDSYKLMSNAYNSMYGANDLDSIKISIIKSDDTLDAIMKYNYANDEQLRTHVDNLPEGVKDSIRFLYKKTESKNA